MFRRNGDRTMIDKLKLSLFLKPQYLTVLTDGTASLHYPTLGCWGFKVSAGSVDYEEIYTTDGNKSYVKTTTREQSPWDKIPSSYSGLAMKWWDSNSLTSQPRLEIKGSPAKLMQGHNVFGSVSIQKCAFFMLKLVQDNYPDLVDAIDWSLTTFDLIDVTYSAKLDPKHHLNFIQWLRNISNGQMRKSTSSEEYKTTCYWGKGAKGKSSKHKVLKAYLKHTEMQEDLAALKKQFTKNPFEAGTRKRLEIMQDKQLQDFAKPLVRFEATLKKDWFKNNIKSGRLPRYLAQNRLVDWVKYQRETEAKGECLILNLWLASFDKLFDALNGEEVNMQNETEIHEKLKTSYFRETKNGLTFTKADKIFGFYMRIINEGYDKVYRTYARNTFKRLLDDLIDATGLSKGHLQNLHTLKDTNVIPFCQLININFNEQIPTWAA